MLLNDQTPAERREIEKIGHRRKYRAGEFVIRENEAGQSLFIILSGSIEVRKELDSGRDKRLKELYRIL